MLAWIASYPRSGNTFMRMLLKQVFDLPSASVYKEDLKFFEKTPDLVSIVGEVGMEYDRPFCVKTHDLPSGNAPAIYVVRDGRAAIVSYWHFLREVGRMDAAMEDVIEGRNWPCGWSSHVAAWAETGQQVLLVRYEDMLHDLPAVINQIGEFLTLRPLRELDISFAKLHAINPAFFRKGENTASIAEISPHLASFDLHHGKMMRRLGYMYEASHSLETACEHLPLGARFVYAKFGEDIAIAHLLGNKRVGRYIDVESDQALYGSNTAFLHSMGWSGLNINSHKVIVSMFERIRPRDGNLHQVVGPKGLKGRPFFGEVAATVRPLHQVMDSWLACSDEVHFLNVASEDAVMPAITTFDWKRHQPLLVALKIDEKRTNDIQQVLAFRFMAAEGYELRSYGIATAIFKKR